jgi:hypothetical protein
LPLLDTALVAAIVSAVITMLGWLASHWSERRLEAKRRTEKVTDVQAALLAEIESNLKRYQELDLDGHAFEMNRLIRKSRTFTPFVPRYVSEVVFEAMIAEAHLLPTQTIDDVVAFYKQEYKLRELVEDLRSDRYASLEPDRKALMYEDYVWQIKTTLLTGNRARDALLISLGLPRKPHILSSQAAAWNPASENPRQALVWTVP